jgi:hypothetical protein
MVHPFSGRVSTERRYPTMDKTEIRRKLEEIAVRLDSAAETKSKEAVWWAAAGVRGPINYLIREISIELGTPPEHGWDDLCISPPDDE